MATRHGTARPAQHQTQRFLDAALKILMDQGVVGLTVRGVAEAAGASTIAVYTRFGGRAGLLDALYEHTFDLLHDALEAAPPPSGDPIADIVSLGLAYRRFALESPARYALMLERPVPDFDPDPALRVAVLKESFGILAHRVQRITPSEMDPMKPSFLLWGTMHGLISYELTQQSRGAIPGWFLEPTEEANEPIFVDGVRAMIIGLGLGG